MHSALLMKGGEDRRRGRYSLWNKGEGLRVLVLARALKLDSNGSKGLFVSFESC